ncbi:hypothetical protein K1F50_15570 [Muricauda oceani]|uniref:DUF6602 domain-containing protein n=1 Tax=Flagellimonas oceani TaxID=2698672 RepID=A0A6G7IZU4_9FLAO|nr:DUF6602 domain-containing protein [Allomuricauda oceani]MBW8244227.1 hypothetical protein [Allomuricauda oceani]QII44123.1 hypothetical protein GVT53_05360 [Allomuricauda oceani]
MSSKVNIRKLFGGLQNQMVAQLNTNREFIGHPSSKGDSLENTWIEWLRNYLPNRYCVDKAIIIDSKGQLSHQIDLVIYDQTYTPFVFKQNGIFYIPAEGVYAVFEVKPELDKGNIEYAGEKIESVRKLFRTSTNMIDRGKLYNPRTLTKILGGILTIETSIAEMTIEKHLKNLKGLKAIDIGCAVKNKSFYVDFLKDDSVFNIGHDTVLTLEEHNDIFVKFYEARKVDSIEFSQKNNSLVTFFLQLTRYLQQSIGTVAAIDLSEYAKSINFDIDDDL